MSQQSGRQQDGRRLPMCPLPIIPNTPASPSPRSSPSLLDEDQRMEQLTVINQQLQEFFGHADPLSAAMVPLFLNIPPPPPPPMIREDDNIFIEANFVDENNENINPEAIQNVLNGEGPITVPDSDDENVDGDTENIESDTTVYSDSDQNQRENANFETPNLLSLMVRLPRPVPATYPPLPNNPPCPINPIPPPVDSTPLANPPSFELAPLSNETQATPLSNEPQNSTSETTQIVASANLNQSINKEVWDENTEEQRGRQLYKQLVGLLDCPVCMDVIRPGTSTIGLCDNGHILCEKCSGMICDKITKKGSCPSCRSTEMKQVTRNFLAFSFIEAVSNCTNYKCKYETCNTTRPGDEILGHEKFCPEKPLGCPKRGCKVSIPYYGFLNKQHSCLNLIRPEPKMLKANDSIINTWKFIINLQDIFSFDTSSEKVAKTFKPFLLLPTKNGSATFMENLDLPLAKKQKTDENAKETNSNADHTGNSNATVANNNILDDADSNKDDKKEDLDSHDKLFFTVLESRGGGIVAFITSLENKADVCKLTKQKEFIISMQVYSFAGKIGPASKINPVFEGTIMNRTDQGVFLISDD